jgi:dsRNA-specific ribonuclease
MSSDIIVIAQPNYGNEQEFTDKLAVFLRDKLQFIGNNAIIDSLLSPVNLKIWVSAFTHESYNPNADSNYDRLEYIGDRVLITTFSNYLYILYPDYSESEYTELFNSYMSKIKQGNLSKDLQLPTYVRPKNIFGSSNFNIEADLFESFIGALKITGDNYSAGSGNVLAYNFIASLKIGISTEDRFGAPKTQVRQIFHRFGQKEPVVSLKEESNGNITISIYLTNANIKFLQDSGITNLTKMLFNVPINSLKKQEDNERNFNTFISSVDQAINMTEPLRKFEEELYKHAFPNTLSVLDKAIMIGSANGDVKHTVENAAYTNALAYLRRIGIDQNWMERQRERYEFSNPRVKELLPAVRAKYEREGYTSIDFYIPRKLKNEKKSVLILIALKDKRKYNLVTIETSKKHTNFVDEKVMALQTYLRP